MSRRTQSILWSLVFLLFFAFSQDLWRWGNELVLTIGGLPGWLLYFVGLQLLFAGAILLFIKSYWEREN